ncbi:MAG: ABC transporter ATP-binding protein [Clostridia bacterium]|nr:ABC transporter ATP-binding protein [Clostridia bacterium]
MLKRFLSYYKPHKRIFFWDMTASLFVALIAILYPILTREMLNDLIPNGKYSLVVWAGLGLLALYIVRMLLNYFIQYYGHVMGVKMQAQMRSELFTHLEKLPYSYFDNHETGKLMTRMTSDLWEISELAHHGPENLLISTITAIASFIFLSTIDIRLTLVIFVAVPFLLVAAMKLRVKMRNAFKESREAVGKINACIEGSISGIRTTKAYNNSAKEQEKFEEGNEDFIYARYKAYKAMGQFHASTSFITDIFNVIVLIAGGFFYYKGYILFGDYSAFVVSVNMFLSPVMTLINFMEQYQNGVTGFERFLEVLDAEPEKDSEGAVDAGVLEGDIEFRSVSYGYDGVHDVLHGIDLKLEKGKTVALVGPSGGGKTTVCHLIPRFYDIENGELFLDGRPAESYTRESIRRNIGIVQQDVYLFNSTIRDNILYGRPDATEEEVIDAAKKAGIHDYITTLEKGYDTEVGERGVRLSGGQKQRLSIARIFLKNPPILILDEATSALDNATEILIQNALNELCEGRTTLIVAHRLSTVQCADEIVVVSDGRITERGTHTELLEKGGVYAGLYRSHLRA